MEDDKKEYWAAFAIGAILGIGATLLLAPPHTPAQRILYEIEPALDRARKGSKRVARRGVKKARRALRKHR